MFDKWCITKYKMSGGMKRMGKIGYYCIIVEKVQSRMNGSAPKLYAQG
jgi:hypothetical protein